MARARVTKKGISQRNNGASKSRKKLPLVPIFSLLILILFGVYLYLSLQLVEMNFQLKKKEEALLNLEAKSQELETKIENRFSVANLKNIADKNNLEKPQAVKYLKPSEEASSLGLR